MPNIRRETMQAIRNKNLFDFISNQGHRLTKFELIDIIKELDYGIYSIRSQFDSWKDIYDNACESLTERWTDQYIQDIKAGDKFYVNGVGHVAAENAHQNFDDPDEPWIVYDEDGNVWFEEDIV